MGMGPTKCSEPRSIFISKDKIDDQALPGNYYGVVFHHELPEGCFGWKNFDPTEPLCVICDFNIECMRAKN